MGLRARIALLLACVLVVVLSTATFLHLRMTDGELNGELVRRAGHYSRVIADDVVYAAALGADAVEHLRAQIEHAQRLPGVEHISVYSGRSDGPDLGLATPDVTHPEAAAVLAAQHSRELAAGAPGGPGLLKFVPGASEGSGVVLILKLDAAVTTEERWATARFLADALSMDVRRVLVRRAESLQLVQDLCVRLAEIEEVTAVEVFDKKGRVSAHSNPSRIGSRPQPAHEEYVRALYESGGSRAEYLREKERYNRFISISRPSAAGLPETIAVVELAMDTVPIQEGIQRDARRSLLVLLVLTTVACGVIFIAVGRLVVRPLERLLRATHGVAEGHFDYPAVPKSRHEVGRLAQGFDEMVKQLRQTTVSRDFMEAVLDSMSEALFITDAQQVIVRANRTAHVLTSYGADQLVGLSLSDLLQPEEEGLDGTGPSRSGSVCAADGRRVPVLFSCGDLPAAHGPQPRRVWVVRDVTEYARARADIEESRQALERVQRVEAIGRLAGGVAHDLNNVLSAVIGYADMLLDRLDPGSRPHKDAHQIQRAAERATALTSQLLAFGRRQALQPRVLDLNRVVTELLGMLGQLAGSSVEIVTDFESELDLVHLDLTRIEQVLVNLVVNARDAMPDGGRITLETRNLHLSDRAAHERGFDTPGGPYVQVSVTDTGVGMDAETQAHMFEPFFTTKTTEFGTGLGLSTAYGIVKQSGGSITCDSELGLGTRFDLTFPREAARGSGTADDAPGRAAEPETSVVLLVEDDEVVRKLCHRYLRSSGYEVIEAADGESACAVLENGSDGIHMLVTDLRLPGMDGRGVVAAWRAVRADRPALIMSGHVNVHGSPTLDLGDTGFLAKPFTGPQLVRVVRAALDRWLHLAY